MSENTARLMADTILPSPAGMPDLHGDGRWSADETPQFLIVCQQLWLNESGHGVDYMPSGPLGPFRSAVIAAAIDDLGHDDFNVATVVNGRVVAFGFDMVDFGPEEDGELHGGYDLDEITRACGLDVAR